MNAFISWGYRRCYGTTWWSAAWCSVWFRIFCPHPIIENKTARACINSGNCGCNNGPSAAVFPSNGAVQS